MCWHFWIWGGFWGCNFGIPIPTTPKDPGVSVPEVLNSFHEGETHPKTTVRIVPHFSFFYEQKTGRKSLCKLFVQTGFIWVGGFLGVLHSFEVSKILKNSRGVPMCPEMKIVVRSLMLQNLCCVSRPCTGWQGSWKQQIQAFARKRHDEMLVLGTI